YPGSTVSVVFPIFVFFTVVDVPAVLLLGMWFVLQFVGQFSTASQTAAGGIGWWAHIGGFVIGIILMIVLPKDDLSKYYSQSRWVYAAPRRRGGVPGFVIGLVTLVGEVLQIGSL